MSRRNDINTLQWLLAEKTWLADMWEHAATEHLEDRDRHRATIATLERSEGKWRQIAQTATDAHARIDGDCLVLADGERWSAASLQVVLDEYRLVSRYRDEVKSCAAAAAMLVDLAHRTGSCNPSSELIVMTLGKIISEAERGAKS